MLMKSFYLPLCVFASLVITGCGSSSSDGGGGGGGGDDVSFTFEVYDNFDSSANINTNLWNTYSLADHNATQTIQNNSLLATAAKTAGFTNESLAGVEGRQEMSIADKQAFQADFTILSSSGEARTRAELRFSLPVLSPSDSDYISAGITFNPDGYIGYFVSIWDSDSEEVIEEIHDGDLASDADSLEAQTLLIGFQGSRMIFGLNGEYTFVSLGRYAIDTSDNWAWFATRARVRNSGDAIGEQTGSIQVRIDNVQTGVAN